MIKKKNIKEKDSIIEYGLKDIQLQKFTLTEINEVDLNIENIAMQLQLKGQFSENGNDIEITVIVTVSRKRKSKLQKIGELKVKYVFNVSGTENLKEAGRTYLPKNLLNTFNAISISTTRGILFTKFQGTKINKFILPLIDYRQFKIEYEQI
jgi:hypothetical protein